MLRRISVIAAACALLAGLPAEARFGKKSKRSTSSTTTSEPESQAQAQASSEPSASAVGTQSSSGDSTGYRVHRHRPRWGFGFSSGIFVPRYGYSYDAPQVQTAQPVEEEPQTTLRVLAGGEAQGFFSGFTLGVVVGVEGDRWGFNASAQNIAVAADDGTPGFDNLQVANAHLSFAFLTGQYGRLRIEGGADMVFAPDLIAVGPTGGLSGVLWVGGPFALEASLMVTPFPYQQLDARLGAAVGLGPVGLRAGWRTQLLDDRGMVDGIVHRDTFMGPYVGVSFVF